MTIRRATAADVPAICALVRAARVVPGVHTPDEDLAFFGGLVEHTYVAGDVDGVLVLSPGHVEQLYVAPDRQGCGIGSALLRHAQALSPDGLELWVFQRSVRAIAFYERHGFEIVRRTDGARNEEGEPDALMRWR